MTTINTQEIECRFLEIDKEALIKKLLSLGAEDQGEAFLEEMIICDAELKWAGQRKFVRIRKAGNKTTLCYKEIHKDTVDGTYEIEFEVSDAGKTELFLEKIGMRTYRHQEKKRHTFVLNGVTFDIDTWPKVPTYVELEGESEEALKDAAKAVGFDWKDADTRGALRVIEDIYHIPVSKMRWFTFDRTE